MNLWSFGRNRYEKDIRRKYQSVFGTPDGQDVLTDLMTRLHAFDETVKEGEVALKNFSVLLWGVIGFLDGPGAEKRFIQAALRNAVSVPEGEE